MQYVVKSRQLEPSREIKRGLSYWEFELLGVEKKKYWKLEGKGVSVYFSIQSGHILLKYNY